MSALSPPPARAAMHHASAAARQRRLLDRLDLVHGPEQRQRLLHALAEPAQPTVLSFLNQHAFNLASQAPSFGRDLLHSQLLLRDGVGVALCLRMLARDAGLNMNGTDLIPEIAARYAGRRTAVAGTAEPYLGRAVQRLRELGLDVVCAIDGFGEEERSLQAIAQARPELVLLGMGMPKQERIAALLAARLRHPALIVNGGAILDFLAGRFARAPAWLRRLRLEWLFRLAQEPRRLWRRYLLGGGRFLLHSLRLAWASEAEGAAAPGAELSQRDVPPPARAGDHTPYWETAALSSPAEPLFAPQDPRIAQLVRRLDAHLPQTAARIVQFIGAGRGEGASALAHSYALACARLHKRRVLLLSDDLDSGGAWPNLVEEALLGGAAAASQALRVPGDEVDGGLSRARLSAPARSYQDNHFVLADPALWAALGEGFDDIVVDAGPGYGLAVAPRASGVILVVAAEASRASRVRRLLEELRAVDARVLGSILNKRRSYLPQALHERL